MKFLPRIRSQPIALGLLAGVVGIGITQPNAQTASPAANQKQAQVALVRSVKVVLEKDGPAVEIISSRPLVPLIQKLDGPERLVIDLPGANLSVRQKRIDFRSGSLSAVRIDQYQKTPPIARVVVDLLQPATYTWDAAGNRLMVRLRPAEEAAAKPPSIPVLRQSVQPAIVPVSAGTAGAVVLAGSRIAAGSSVTAGADTAVMRLGRGGEVRVCPGTTVSVTSSSNGRDLMLGMSTGALEAHYALQASADSILTPDFRILLAGPGEFHFAVSADSRGNTCVRALPGNTASAIVSEVLGDGTYQVKPSQQVVFHAGQLSAVDVAVPRDCGCPEPTVPMMRASEGPVIPEANLPASLHLSQPGDEVKPVPPPVSTAGLPGSTQPPAQVTLSVLPPETAPLPAPHPNEVQVQVDAPFVFRASDLPAPIPLAVTLPPGYSSRPLPPQTVVLPPAPRSAANKPEHHGFLGKLKGFFGAIFR